MGDIVGPALAHLDAHWDHWIEELKTLVRVPGVSAEPPPNAEVKRSAQAVKAAMERAGFEHVEVIDFPGGHPYVYGDWLHADGAPTLLLYGHHDVMPPGRPEKWVTPAFEPTLREDGRLYGRGVVDDKAGVMVHVAAVASYLRTAKRLPVNVKLIVEGEEESGSGSLSAFLETYSKKLAADVMVLTDTANHEAGLPSLTVSLRGLVGVRVEVAALDHPIHSGMAGGPIPDPVMGLCKAIGELTDDKGRIAPQFWKGVRTLTKKEHADIAALPYSEPDFRRELGVLDGVKLVGDLDTPVWGRVWRQPAVTVIAMEARPIVGSTNQIVESAQARISARIVPDQSADEIQDLLVHHFETRVPWGLRATVTREHAATWWMTEPSHQAFQLGAKAMAKGYGKPTVLIGCGGSIPFVDPFARHLGGVPALLMGVEDPRCNAHGENESLNLDDYRKGMYAAIHLYDELSKLGR